MKKKKNFNEKSRRNKSYNENVVVDGKCKILKKKKLTMKNERKYRNG